MIYNKNKNVPYTESLKKGNNNYDPLVLLSLLPFLILGGGVWEGGWVPIEFSFLRGGNLFEVGHLIK